MYAILKVAFAVVAVALIAMLGAGAMLSRSGALPTGAALPFASSPTGPAEVPMPHVDPASVTAPPPYQGEADPMPGLGADAPTLPSSPPPAEAPATEGTATPAPSPGSASEIAPPQPGSAQSIVTPSPATAAPITGATVRFVPGEPMVDPRPTR